jgi:hypothetical protein
MPAEKFLQPDDILVAIDGRAVREPRSITAIVQAMAPGTRVRVELLRKDREANGVEKKGKDGRPIMKRVEVTFPLGSGRDLENASAPGTSTVTVSAERKELASRGADALRAAADDRRDAGEREDSRRYAVLDPDIHRTSSSCAA